MQTPEMTVLELLYGRWRAQAMYAGVVLGVFECLEETSMSTARVARKLDLDPGMTYRLLRALASIDLLTEHPDQLFSLSEAGRVLRRDHPASLRDIVLLREGPEHTAVWKHLPAIVRDGNQNGFVREYGRTAFDHAAHEPGYARAFDAGMSSHSRSQTAWVLEALSDYDFSAIRHLCDVGGGQGHLLCHLLARHPHLRGTVLERASVIERTDALWAKQLGVGDRCEYVAGDMFADVVPADAYVMKMILHDWNDEECVEILRNLRRRVSPAGRVLIVEHVVPGIGISHFSKLFDLHMMCWGPGRERTAAEYAQLLQRAGWNPVANRFPEQKVVGVIEGANGRTRRDESP